MPERLFSSVRTYASLATGAGTVLAARVAGAGLNYGAQIVLARLAGADQYGAYSFVMAWAALLCTFSGGGLPQAVVRFVPAYHSKKRWGLLKGVTERSEHMVLALSSAAAALGAGLVAGSETPWTASYRSSFLLGFAFVPVLSLLRLQTAICVARQQVRMAYVAPQVLRPLSIIVGALMLAFWFEVPISAKTAVLLAGLPVVPIWLAQRWAFRRQLPDAFHDATATHDTAHWVRTALPMLFITGFLLLLGQTDLLMIGFLMEDAKYVGVYKVASKTASLVLFPLFAVNAVVAPRFAELSANGLSKDLQDLAATAAKWIFWSSLTMSIVLVAGSGFLLGLFGPSFLQGQGVLWILVAGNLSNAGAGSVGPLLTMTGHQQNSAKVYGVCAAMNIFLNAVGIYFMGVLGAAMATAVSTLLWNVGLYRLVVEKLGVFPSVLDHFRSPPI